MPPIARNWNIIPAMMATPRTVITNAATRRFSKIEARSVTSGILAPVPPMINAITAPIPIPFPSKTALMGMMVSACTYIGTPMIAATGMASGFCDPTSAMIRFSGKNP